jgi:hypothetical protein
MHIILTNITSSIFQSTSIRPSLPVEIQGNFSTRVMSFSVRPSSTVRSEVSRTIACLNKCIGKLKIDWWHGHLASSFFTRRFYYLAGTEWSQAIEKKRINSTWHQINLYSRVVTESRKVVVLHLAVATLIATGRAKYVVI